MAGLKARDFWVGTVLVVDDEPPVRSVAERALRHAGYKVVLAESGREAIDALTACPEIGAVILEGGRERRSCATYADSEGVAVGIRMEVKENSRERPGRARLPRSRR